MGASSHRTGACTAAERSLMRHAAAHLLMLLLERARPYRIDGRRSNGCQAAGVGIWRARVARSQQSNDARRCGRHPANAVRSAAAQRARCRRCGRGRFLQKELAWNALDCTACSAWHELCMHCPMNGIGSSTLECVPPLLGTSRRRSPCRAPKMARLLTPPSRDSTILQVPLPRIRPPDSGAFLGLSI